MIDDVGATRPNKCCITNEALQMNQAINHLLLLVKCRKFSQNIKGPYDPSKGERVLRNSYNIV